MAETRRGSVSGGGTAPFDAESRAQTKQWLDNWKRAGPILEDIRVRELRQLTESESGRIVCEVLWPSVTPGGGDDGEGLTPIKNALRQLALRP